MKKIAIASGKGGTGKTFLTTNLYNILQGEGRRVAVVDCDAEVPNASLFLKGDKLQEWPTIAFCPQIEVEKCTFCSLCATHCHFHAITCIPVAHYIKVLPDLCHACEGCLQDCASDAIHVHWKATGSITAYGQGDKVQLIEARLKEGEHSPVDLIREAIAKGEEMDLDYLLLDAPPGCSCPFVNTVMDADYVILVSEPTPFGLSDLKHTVDVLHTLKKPFSVVINRADLGNSQMKEYLAENQIPLLAEIPYSENIAKMYSKGTLAVNQDQSLKQILANIAQHVTTT